jgi:hypothetical protein
MDSVERGEALNTVLVTWGLIFCFGCYARLELESSRRRDRVWAYRQTSTLKADICQLTTC